MFPDIGHLDGFSELIMLGRIYLCTESSFLPLTCSSLAWPSIVSIHHRQKGASKRPFIVGCRPRYRPFSANNEQWLGVDAAPLVPVPSPLPYGKSAGHPIAMGAWAASRRRKAGRWQ